MSLRRGAMDLRDLPQSRPLLPLHDVPAMDRRALRDLGLVRARRRAVDRETGQLPLVAQSGSHALRRVAGK
jgi:hypothetical protein